MVKIVTSILDVMVTITVQTRIAGRIVDTKVAVAQNGMVRENRVVEKTGTTEKPVTMERLVLRLPPGFCLLGAGEASPKCLSFPPSPPRKVFLIKELKAISNTDLI